MKYASKHKTVACNFDVAALEATIDWALLDALVTSPLGIKEAGADSAWRNTMLNELHRHRQVRI